MKKHLFNGLFVLTLLGAITQTASALPTGVPEVGSTSLLLGVAFGGMVTVRRFFRR